MSVLLESYVQYTGSEHEAALRSSLSLEPGGRDFAFNIRLPGMYCTDPREVIPSVRKIGFWGLKDVGRRKILPAPKERFTPWY